MPDTRALYLDLLKKSLLHTLYPELDLSEWMPSGTIRDKLLRLIIPSKGRLFVPGDETTRLQGEDWPQMALTMIGSARLDNIRHCVETALRESIPGDLIETGVWRGGASIFMRGLLAAWGVRDRSVFVADSFAGLPPPDKGLYPADRGSMLHEIRNLSVSVDQVRANFQRYGLLDDQVRFLVGWFKETLPSAPLGKLAVVRLDGDMYESTMDGLVNLYPKLSPGGFLIVDDYLLIPACRQAVDDYRTTHGIREEVCPVDWTAVYWRREG